MSTRIEPLAGERESGESNRAVQACNDYLRFGPGRSLSVLLNGYREVQGNTTPTQSKNTLEAWSTKYSWQSRAAIYDQRLEDAKNARAKQIMESGLALDYERVVELKGLADFLKQQIFTQTPVVIVATPEGEPEGEGEAPAQLAIGETYPYVWLRDVKQIGQGKDAQRVDIVRFNAALLDQFRGVLDDLAKETGGRISKHEMSGPNGGAIPINDEQHDRAISTLAAAIGALIPGSGASAESDLGSTEQATMASAADQGV